MWFHQQPLSNRRLVSYKTISQSQAEVIKVKVKLKGQDRPTNLMAVAALVSRRIHLSLIQFSVSLFGHLYGNIGMLYPLPSKGYTVNKNVHHTK